MPDELSVLIIAAATIGLFHTLIGPDHYLPFIVMSKSGKWSLRKTTLVTLFCGLGHVLSSVILGMIGVAFGVAISKLESVESFRGNIAAWAMIVFGLLYFIWGLRQAYRNQSHQHFHAHNNDITHRHTHSHAEHAEHLHVHKEAKNETITPWVLFAIFVFGPCEPLIPLLMYPAANLDIWSLIIVTGTFGLVTISTMLSIVLLSVYGISFLPMSRIERYTHAIAGATILISGLSIQLLGL